MASSQLYSDQVEDAEELLKQPGRAKEFAVRLVKRYSADTENGFDGSLHPALDSRGEAVVAIRPLHGLAERDDPVGEQMLAKREADIAAEEQRFLGAMREYEGTAKDKYKTGIKPEDSHTMADVWVIIDDAVARYQAQGKEGIWGRIRGAFRKFGENDGAVKTWLGLLPTESNYLSVLCGGLKMIVSAAARMRNIAEEIIQALQNIPMILNGAQRVLSVYRDSQKLRSLSSALYSSMLQALGHMLGYLRGSNSFRGQAVKVFAAVATGPSYQKSLTDKVRAIEMVRDLFNREADICQQEVIRKIKEITYDNNQTTGDLVRALGQMQQALIIASNEQQRTQTEIGETQRLMLSNQEELKVRMEQMQQTLNAQNHLMDLFMSKPELIDFSNLMLKRLEAPNASVSRNRSPQSSLISPPPNRKPHPSKRSQAELKKLLTRLDYNPDAGAVDVVANYNLVARLSPEDQERSLYMIRSPVLAAWMTATESSALVMNGGSSDVRWRSAVSFVCARLVYALDQMQSSKEAEEVKTFVPLYFFCGEHSSFDHSWETPSGVLNIILAQLLTHCRKDIDASLANELGPFDTGDVKALFKRLDAILAQLPALTTIVCVIDSVSFYLNDSRTEHDAELLTKYLLRLARHRSSKRCIFKLMLTAPNRVQSVATEDLEEGEVINVPRSLPNTGGFTAMKWNSGISQRLGELVPVPLGHGDLF